MEHCLTARQREIVELAGRLADEFAERASEHDRDGSFPFENYERMREEGYLGLTVPEELGGMGAGLYDLILAQERLAAGDGSTALAVNMHVSPIGQLASLWRASGDERLADVLRRAADGRLVYASMSAEPGRSDPDELDHDRTACGGRLPRHREEDLRHRVGRLHRVLDACAGRRSRGRADRALLPAPARRRGDDR